MELWFTEYHKKGAGLTMKVRRTLWSRRSPYQEIDVLETENFGRMLVIDGLVMCTERDEFIYHEMMAHPALFLHRAPRDVLVIGGGDGGTVREVAKHGGVERIVLCEIDRMVLEAAKRFLPGLSNTLFSDKRVGIVEKDAVQYLQDKESAFDVVLVDSSDPVGPAKRLFQKEFFEMLKKTLRDDGIIVFQSESPFYDLDIIKNVNQYLKDVGFLNVNFYWAPVPTYPGGTWSWAMASNTYHPLQDFDEGAVNQQAVNQQMELRYYNSRVHLGAFCLPGFFQSALEQG